MYNKTWICKHCGYDTNKKQNYEKHISRPSACEKRIKRQRKSISPENVIPKGNNVTPNVTLNNESQLNIKNNNHSLQCPFCKKTFANRSGKSRHIKAETVFL